jgi:dihydroflavonol-4-reductase
MILVTGATGFIGGHLLEALSAAGERVRCLVRRKTDLPAEPAFGDLARNEGLADALRGVRAVIHLAGVTKALRPEEYYTGNVAATRHLLQAACGVERFVHVSSLAAIGPGSHGRPVTEDDEPHPLTHYGRSKRMAEESVRASALADRAVILRPPVVYGPRDTDVFQMLKSVSRGWTVQIAGGERRFSAIYVKDLAQALLLALRRAPANAAAYFVAHPDPVTWTRLGDTAAAIMGRRVRAVTVPRAVARGIGFGAEIWSMLVQKPGIISREKVAEACCDNWLCSTGRARKEWGFEAPTDLRTGLAETLAWYREAGWLHY